MTRTAYREQLETLRTDVLAMSELVCERYEAALSALEAGDPAPAGEVIAGDAEVNAQYLALEGDCVGLVARQQPVAGDLRFIASSFKILTDLERVGDLATNVARVAGTGPVEQAGDRADPAVAPVDPAVLAVGREAGGMLADAMDAYADDDAAACWAIAERDDDLDDRCEAVTERVVADLLRAGGEGATDAAVAAAWQTLVLVRDVERVGDHAVNVAARTLYAVEHDDSLLF